MKRWVLIFVATFALVSAAHALAGWRGWAIFMVAATFGLVVGATDPHAGLTGKGTK